MAFELVGKRRAKLLEVNVQSLKVGQTELHPAISLRWKCTLPNREALPMLDATLLAFLYEKNSAAQTQGTLEGVPVVSDMPQLTAAARKLGSFGWKDEQTGCGLIVYQGVTGDGDIRLKDGTRTILKVEPREGGTCDVTFDFDASDLDADIMGALAVLKNHEPDIELTAPEIISAQGEIEDGDDDDQDEAEQPQTPEAALAASVQKPDPAWPFPDSAHKDKPKVPVTTRRKRKAEERAAAAGKQSSRKAGA